MTAERDYDIGVVLVHGIGTSRPDDTLLEWGKPLFRVLGAKADDVDVALHENPARAQFTIEGRTVRVVESAWGELFRPPGYFSFLRWSIRSIPTTVIAHFDERYRRASQSVVRHFEDHVRENSMVLVSGAYLPFVKAAIESQEGHRQQVLAFLVELLVLFFGLILAPFVMLVLLLLPVLSFVPALREFAESTKETLTSYVGDSQVLASGDLESKGIIAKVRHDVETLCRKSTRCVVVAHSQGAAIAHEVLRNADTHGSEVRFVSFGSGLRKIHELYRCANDTTAVALAWAATVLSAAALAIILLVGAAAWTGPGIGSLAAIGAALAVFGYALAVNVGGLALRMVGYSVQRELVPEHKDGIRRRWNWIAVAAVFGFAAFFREDWMASFYAGRWPWILTPVLMGMAFTLLMEWRYAVARASAIADQKIYESAQWTQHYALHGVEWLDVYGSCDPVPNGPVLDVLEADGYRAVPLMNTLSPTLDHTSYMRERNSRFLALVANEILRDGKAEPLAPPPLYLTTPAEMGYRIYALSIAGIASFVTLYFDVYGWFAAQPIVVRISAIFGALIPAALTALAFLVTFRAATWLGRLAFADSIAAALASRARIELGGEEDRSEPATPTPMPVAPPPPSGGRSALNPIDRTGVGAGLTGPGE